MVATKKSYELINNIITEYSYGSLVGLEWTSADNNVFRVYTVNPINAGTHRNFSVEIRKEIKPIGVSNWIPYGSYRLEANDTTYRSLSTGLKVPASEALDENGNLNSGYLTDCQFFINIIGYNLYNSNTGLYNFIYAALAEKESVTI